NYSTSATRAVEEMEEKKDVDMDSVGVPQASDPTHDLIAMELSKGAPLGDKLGEQKESQSKKVDKKAFASAPSAIAAKSKLEAPKTLDAAETDALGIPISIKESIKKGNYSLALQELDNIILLNDQRKEEALWLKSNCLIQMDKVEEAKEILKLLANSKGNFAAKASEALKSLK
ncbi:MAG: hypothetical protein K2Q22_14410, partial [Cytophagales bacterium]|nr:hypothetical protein [Cytophagales bacterium]